MKLANQTKHQAEQIATLRAVYALRGRRKDVFAFIRAYPRAEWLFFFEELGRLFEERYSRRKEAGPLREMVS